MTGISGVARMNLAALDDDTLHGLWKFFVLVRDHGTEDGASRAPAWLDAIAYELFNRTAHKEADE